MSSARDVMDSFLELTAARSAEDVVMACRADPRLLDPAFEESLTDVEGDLRARGQDVDALTAWRLVLRSVREGRNLYASADELLRTPSARALRDLAINEPLLLHPLVDSLLAPMVRATRQQGDEALADAMEARRRFLGRLRAHGPVDGYFDILVSELAAADPAREADLVIENADLVDEFRRYVREQGRIATHLGDHDRIQQLQFAALLMSGGGGEPARPEDSALGERAGRLADLVFGPSDLDSLLDSLIAAPELLSDDTVGVVVGQVRVEIDRAALDRDVVNVRELWMTHALLLRCAEIGAAGAFDELNGGLLWPQPDETL
jgi:hypothetical protein